MRNQRCKYCGELKTLRQCDIYCSPQCQKLSHSKARPNVTCAVCGCKIWQRPSRIAALVFCSTECWRQHDHASQKAMYKIKQSQQKAKENDLSSEGEFAEMERYIDPELAALDAFEAELNKDFNLWVYPTRKNDE